MSLRFSVDLCVRDGCSVKVKRPGVCHGLRLTSVTAEATAQADGLGFACREGKRKRCKGDDTEHVDRFHGREGGTRTHDLKVPDLAVCH